jgi:DNA-directed RNA polymerase subunit RPC12/RpoP
MSFHNTDDLPGIPCPQCGTLIQISIESLLFASRYNCVSCSLVIEKDASESATALGLLQQLYIAQKNVDDVKRRFS